MSDGVTHFADQGYAVIPALFCATDLQAIRERVDLLVTRHRAGEAAVLSMAVSIADVSRQHPQRNPGVTPEAWKHEPYIIGDLIALDVHFAAFLAKETLWLRVAELLACPPVEVVFHFCNLTRKPARIGPAIGWHRDADNRYFAAEDGRTLRLLIPLHPMSVSNGGTALVPGSHLARDASSEHSVCPEVPAGYGLAIHSALLHGGSPNRSEDARDALVVQFGHRASTLRHYAPETLSLASREVFLRHVAEQGEALER